MYAHLSLCAYTNYTLKRLTLLFTIGSKIEEEN